jgi:hypothetical protein
MEHSNGQDFDFSRLSAEADSEHAYSSAAQQADIKHRPADHQDRTIP